MKKNLLLLVLFVSVLCCTLNVSAYFENEAAEENMLYYSNKGLKLSLLEKYGKFFIVDASEDSPYLFSVFDAEAAKTDEVSEDYPDAPGLLFVIDTITEDEYHELLCDSRYFEVFASDNNGIYYVIRYPDYNIDTDRTYTSFSVEFLNNYPFAGYLYVLYPNNWADGIEKTENFEALEWVATRMKELFIADNGLIREKHGKGAAAIYFSRILYYDDLEYYVDGNKKPDNINAEDYMSPLVYNVNYRPLEAGYDVYRQRDGKKFERILNAPDIDIEFPDDDGSFLLITIEDGNYISYCVFGLNWVDSQCMSFGVEFEDETLQAYDVINTFLEAIKSEPNF